MSRKYLIIGGSPCSGKSTVAEQIAQEFGALYYKVDDDLGRYLQAAAEKGCPACKACMSMSPDEIWMREPTVQCSEEFSIYDEISEFVFAHLQSLDAELIITEGAAYTPQVIGRYGIRDYITIIPTPDFQIPHYKEREWVRDVLRGCADPEQAFRNWMQRDILFAQQVREECEARGIPCIVNDGIVSPDEMFRRVTALFRLG